MTKDQMSDLIIRSETMNKMKFHNITRWMVFILLILLTITMKTVKTDKVFLMLVFFAVAYQITFSIYLYGLGKRGLKPKTGFIYVDAIFVSLLCFVTGGIKSEIYLFYYFLIAYYGIKNTESATFCLGGFLILFYSALCGFQIYEHKGSIEEMISVLFRDVFLAMTVYGSTLIYVEVKKFDDLHKKEFKMARTDKLTGLANRHCLEQKLIEEVEYADLTQNPVNILIFDLDFFKGFNDTYGHLWGDKLLSLFSDIIKANVRKSDIPVRYGGEEFLVIVRDLDIDTACGIGDRIRRQLEKQRIYIGNDENRRRVTVSCGVAQYPVHGSKIKEVINLADKALYYAKDIGRNRVVCYTDMICEEHYIQTEIAALYD